MIEIPIVVKVIPLIMGALLTLIPFKPIITDSSQQKGQIGDYQWEGKVYNEPSKFGINNSRVSKLRIWDKEGKTVVNYERGWDIKPHNLEEQYVVDKIIEGVKK